MRRLLVATMFAALPLNAGIAQTPVAAGTGHICLHATDVAGTIIPDDRTIIFRMNDGTRWKNVLQADCPGLRTAGGFDYAIRGGTICANEQRIRVHDMPATCFLGSFSRVDAPVK